MVAAGGLHQPPAAGRGSAGRAVLKTEPCRVTGLLRAWEPRANGNATKSLSLGFVSWLRGEACFLSRADRSRGILGNTQNLTGQYPGSLL